MLDCHLFLIKSEFVIPTILAITIDETGLGPGVNIGAKCAFSLEQAISSAIIETIQFRFAMRLNAARRGVRNLSKDEVRTRNDRLDFWYSSARVSLLDFWLQSTNCIDYALLEKEFSKCSLGLVLDRFRANKCEIFTCNISLPEMEKAGFEVIKVLTPDLLPLYLDEGAMALYSSVTGEIVPGDDLIPHPFL